MEPEEYDSEYQMHEELSTEFHDPLIRRLHWLIRACVKMLAILMVLVIFLGVIDVCYILYENLKEPPLLTLSVSDIFEVFGAFMVVLIAIEIFINIRLYLGSSTLPIRLVVATALMAIARKVIVMDLAVTSADQILAIGVVTIALGITYWLVGKPAPVAKSVGEHI